MSLHLLLDENISDVVAAQVQKHQPGIVIESVHTWRTGAFRGRNDREILIAASAENLTLVTYDLKTIPNFLIELSAEGRSHAGVIFVDDQTIPNGDFGLMTRSLLSFWNRYHAIEWGNCIRFLDKPPF
jgi:predicted nuclease of predicted toxin-antitoxin system